MRRKLLAGVGFTSVVLGCAMIDQRIQTAEDIRARIDTCHTIEDCESLESETKLRAQCGAVDVSEYPGATCPELRNDYERARSRAQHFRDKAERAKQAQEAKLAADREAKQREEAEADAAKQARFEEWLTTARNLCRRDLSVWPCGIEKIDGALPLSDQQRERCRSECVADVKPIIDVAIVKALDDCISGKTRFCTIDLKSRDMDLNALEQTCNEDCARTISARAQVEEIRRRAASRPKTTTVSPAPVSACGGMAKCCDGACSPTCACPGHQGCCSHHGGLCGC